MTDTSQATEERKPTRYFSDLSKPTYKPPAVPDDERTQSRKLQVTGRLKMALHNMVWLGLKRDDAAIAAGLSVNALYSALRKPHVKAWYLSECEILRTSGRARRLHLLERISESTSNLNASVNAIRTMDAPDSANNPMGSGRSAAVTMPGLVIQIIQQPAALTGHQREIEANPLITLEADTLTESVDR